MTSKLQVVCTDTGLPVGIYFNQLSAVEFIEAMEKRENYDKEKGYHIRLVGLESLGSSIRDELDLSSYECYTNAVQNMFEAIATSYKTPDESADNFLLNALFYLIGSLGGGDLFTEDYIQFILREREV